MGKYQLDNKGQASVEKYHEKNSTDKPSKQDKVAELRAQFLKKKNGGKNEKSKA
ncbi:MULTISPECIES: hypothetical protein [Floricoccus]|uniref:hypothetical protein n=1 Tax=Floricoccus TaxID=1930830 RepID=UPI000C01FE75|nr:MULTISPECIES: hypothetical protein [Floricoccus]URZ87638.1 hypothetical protein KIW23_00895 [Floricoccus penangensis]